jgi:PhoPQ-activated pathogenicity-related protein
MTGLVAVLSLGPLAALPQDQPAFAADPAAAILPEYLARPDPAFGWKVRAEDRYHGAEWGELILTSQSWRGMPWRHQLYVIRPPNMARDAHQALLVIDGGKWRPEYEHAPTEVSPPKRADLFLAIAKRLASPVVVLRQVPNQPLFDGLSEDALIAYTLEQYLRTGEPDWPLLLPMVKSAVRAMDAAQRYAEERWSHRIEAYTVTGASKRGWTTWLTAAADDRVTALAPMVIDVLNMGPQMHHQRETWGETSEQIADYAQRGLIDQLDTAGGRRLLAIVDPYAYREQLTQPKLVILATNDRYWPLDAAWLYWDGLRGPKYPVYLPNQGHQLTDFRRMIAAINAVHQNVARGRPLPDLRWRYEEDPDGLALILDAEPQPVTVRAWLARSASRDFRSASWRWMRVSRRNGQYRYWLSRPARGFRAIYAEAVFGRGDDQVFLSSLPLIAGPADHPDAHAQHRAEPIIGH